MPVRRASTSRAAAARKVPKVQVQYDTIVEVLDNQSKRINSQTARIDNLTERLDEYIKAWQASQVSVWRRGWNKLVVWWEGIHDKTGAEV